MSSAPAAQADFPIQTFTHLHTHSHYSLLDGAGRVDALLKRAKELGMSSLALTDHGAMYGSLDFYETALKLGVKPIIGVEAYLAARTRHDREVKSDQKSFHQILLAETFEGYKNLLKMVSEAHLNGFYYKPRIDMELLRQHSAGIIATSSCFNGRIPRALDDTENLDEGRKILHEFLDIFGAEHFFLELQHHPNNPEQGILNDKLKRLGAEFNVGLIATNDIHYVQPEDSEAQDVLVCVSSGKTVHDTNRLNMTDYDLSMSSPEQMAEYFADTPEALANTVKIAERCNVHIPLGDNILPKYPLPEGTTDRAELRRLCTLGVQTRYGFAYSCDENREEDLILASPINDFAIPIEERVPARLEYELSVIEKMGFESYFLIVQDFINWARAQDIVVGPGRGSAAGSLVGYLVGITNVDPLFHNLIFERFLNPERVSMPDIDTDIEDARREEVIQYVRERYGSDHVAQIITFGTMAARNALRDVGRALGVSYGEVDYIAKLVPSGPQGMTLKQALDPETGIAEFRQVYQSNEQITKLVDIASRLEGVARHTSIHAAGVVISKEPLTEYLPIQRSNKDSDSIVTQYAMSQVEHIGLLKMDFLGLANLSILRTAQKVIKAVRGVYVDIDELPLTDVPSYELLSRAETTGVFQLESAGMKRYLKELKPTQFEDIISMVALYRPGPMDAIPDFIESKHGRKKVVFLHPLLEPTLKDSYGVIVTQDQVLEIARKFAGFSYAEADILRKAVGKKIKALLDEQREKFVNRAAENPTITKAKAEEVWNFIEPFARYGFNRAHAACYALIAYQTAYLKAHYPAEFMASLLTSDTHNLDRIGIEIAECKNMGLEVLAPDVNESFVEFGVVFYSTQAALEHKYDSYIRFGLGAIKNVGMQPADGIVAERKANGPFTSIEDFLKRNCSHLNKKALENLAMAGALDSLVERNQMLINSEACTKFMSFLSKSRNSSQGSLFDGIAEEDGPQHNLQLLPAEPTDQKTRLAWERELLGIYISDHPISTYLPFLPADRSRIAELTEVAEGQVVRICGVVMTVHKILTKANKNMAFVQLEDETGPTEVIVFPRTWEEKEKMLLPGMAICVEGKVSRKDGRTKRRVAGPEDEEAESAQAEELKILMESCSEIKEGAVDSPHNATHLTLHIPENGDRNLLQQIKITLENYPGRIPVTLLLPSTEGPKPLHISHKVDPVERLYAQLAGLLGAERVTAD